MTYPASQPARQATVQGQPPAPTPEPPPLDDAAAARAVSSYVSQASATTGESARSRLLAGLLQSLFGIDAAYIEEIEPESEAFVRVRHKDRAVIGQQTGQPNQLYGNVIIDIEDDLGRSGRGDEARLQLRRYLSCYWTKEPGARRRRYICLATDGLRFELYSPRAPEPGRPAIVPGELSLKRLDMLDARDPAAAAALPAWLDRFVCRRRRLVPQRGSFLLDFGPDSHACHVVTAELSDLWAWLDARHECAAAIEAWRRALAKARGAAAERAPASLFIRHTYLALLARLAAWMRVGGAAGLPDLPAARAVLHGRAFRDRGVAGLIDEPFFPWLLRPEANDGPATLAMGLAGLLAAYIPAESTADALTGLYQQMADASRPPSVETTPAWLAAAVVDQLLEERPSASLLDPACGTGTFLARAIHRKRASMGDRPETMAHIAENVAGIDADPLAVAVAQAGWLASLGILLDLRGPALSVPVYHGDSLCGAPLEADAASSPAVSEGGRPAAYRLAIDGQAVYLPRVLTGDARRCRDAIDAAWQFAANWQGRATEGDFAAFLWPARPDLAAEPAVRAAIFALAEGLRHTDLIGRGARGLQSLQAGYEPLLLRGRFDLVATAPPRLPLGDLSDAEYAAALHELASRTYRLAPANDEALRPADLAPIFLVHTANVYLRPGGIAAGVLPRGVMNAGAHETLRRGVFRGAPLRWTGLWDLEGVTPLFRRPVCVLFGQEGAEAAGQEGMAGRVIAGELAHRDADLEEANSILRRQPVHFYLAGQGSHSVWTTTRAQQASFGF